MQERAGTETVAVARAVARRSRASGRRSAGSTSTSRTSRTRRRSRSPSRFRRRPLPRARSPRRTPRWSRCCEPLLDRPQRRPHARRAHRRPRRVAGRARRGDARHLRVRGHAARAARLSTGRACRPRVVAEPARHVDLLPTSSTRWASRPPGLAGRSLLPRSGAHPRPDGPTYFEALSGAEPGLGAAARHRPRAHQVRRPADPGAVRPRSGSARRTNLAGTQPRRLAEMRGLLASARVGRTPAWAEARSIGRSRPPGQPWVCRGTPATWRASSRMPTIRSA